MYRSGKSLTCRSKWLILRSCFTYTSSLIQGTAMFFRPHFCCNCGEKIDRVEWKIWTSRRFCEYCEGHFQREEWLPKVGLTVSMIGGVLGFGTYLTAPQTRSQENPQRVFNVSSRAPQESTPPKAPTVPGAANVQGRIPVANAGKNEQTAVLTPASKTSRSAPAAEQTSICGATTQKGTSCTRKVKGGGRCWQHKEAAH